MLKMNWDISETAFAPLERYVLEAMYLKGRKDRLCVADGDKFIRGVDRGRNYRKLLATSYWAGY